MCPADDTIAALLEGRLPAKETAAVHAHAADCEQCRQLIAEAARVRPAPFRPHRGLVAEDATEASSGGGSGEEPDDADAYWEVKTQGPLPRGFSVGRYTVLEHLASGGMGSVYAAYDPDLDRRVALKVIATTSAIGADDLRWRLLREAQAMARLSHPNVAVVHEVGTLSGQVFLAMEYVEGSTLREWLNQSARPWQEVLAPFIQAGRGLAAAHERGLVHRDFKPDNVLLGEDGRARVVDFGLVRPHGDTLGDRRPATLSTPLTEVGTLLGTPRYMAPEQMRGKQADGRADQFAFCVALYEALYRVRPFDAETLHERLQQIDRGAFSPPPPGHGVPDRIGAAVRRGLNPEPARRFHSMDDLLAALEGVLQPTRAWWRVALLAAVAGAVVVLGTGGWMLSRRPDRCAGAEARLLKVWGPTRRAAVPPALGPGASALDAYAMRWKNAHARACEAPRAQEEPPRALSARLTCLDRALGELAGAAEALVRAAPDALSRAAALPEPASCLTAAGLARSPSAEAARGELLRRLGELEARLDTEAPPVKELSALVEESEPWARVLAQALLALGRAQARAHPHEPAAEDTLHRAAAAAQRARDDDVATRAWLELADLCARSPSRPAEARRWASYALAAASRTLAPAELEARAHLALCAAALAEGKAEEGLEEHRAAVAILRARPVPDDALLAATLLRGVPLALGAGKPEDAVAAAAEAVRIRQAADRDQPPLAEALEALSTSEESANLWAEAERDQARALAILDKALDPSDLRVARARVRLGELRAHAGAHHDAVKLLGPAVGTLEHAGGVEPRELALAERSLGREQLLSGDPAGAATTLERARLAFERSGPAGAAERPLTLAFLAEARWTAGPKARVRELLEQANGALPAEGGRAFDRAYVSLMLARALLGVPGAVERARGLASEGRAARERLEASISADERALLERLDVYLKERKL